MRKDQLAVGLEFPVFIRIKVTATLVISLFFFFFFPALVTAPSDFARPHITTAYLCFIVFLCLVSHSGLSHSLCICSHLACTVTYFLYYEHCLCQTNACSGCFILFLFLFFYIISRSVFVCVVFRSYLVGQDVIAQSMVIPVKGQLLKDFLSRNTLLVHVVGMLQLQAGSNNTGQLLSTEQGTSVSEFIAITKGNMGSRTTDGLSCRLMNADS